MAAALPLLVLLVVFSLATGRVVFSDGITSAGSSGDISSTAIHMLWHHGGPYPRRGRRLHRAHSRPSRMLLAMPGGYELRCVHLRSRSRLAEVHRLLVEGQYAR